MRRIAVMDDFLSSEHKERIGETAARLGFLVDYFARAEEVLPVLDDYEIFFGHDAAEVTRKGRNLRWFACSFAGIDPYRSDGAWANPNCLFTNAAGAYGVAISEHVIMVLLMLLRQMPEVQRRMRRRDWRRVDRIRSIHGLRLTILGTGDVGTQIACRAKAMGAFVTGVRRNAEKPADPAFDNIYSVRQLEELLPGTDALVLCLPGTLETEGILNRARIELLPDDALVVNVGRGSAVDQEALIDALRGNRLGGAALDVVTPEPLPPEHPLWQVPRLILTPHCSGDMALGYTRDRVVDMFLENLERYAAGEPLRYVPNRRRGY